MENPQNTCENLADFPVKLYHAMSGLVGFIRTPIICGGKDENRQIRDECYILYYNRTWIKGPTLKEPRFGAATVANGDKIVILGGETKAGIVPIEEVDMTAQNSKEVGMC